MDNRNRKLDLLNFRSAITHSLAQNLLSNSLYDMDAYLNEWASLLLNGYDYDVHEVSEVILYARHHAQEEVEVIRNMLKRGISLNVTGHGGSAIDPMILAEIATTKEKKENE